MKTKFTWIPFYKEFAEKLLSYKNNRQPLVDWVNALDDKYVGYLKNYGRIPVTDIDPMSVFAIFNRGIGEKARTFVTAYFKEKMGIEADVPKDYDGIPLVNPQLSYFFDKATNANVQDMWDFMDAAINGKESLPSLFDKELKFHGMKWNITMFLFWIQPYEYLTLDKNTRASLAAKGYKVFREKDLSWGSYQTLLNSVKDAIKEGKEEEIPQISFKAWEKDNGGNELEEKPASNVHYWIYAPGDNARLWEEFYREGVMGLGWDEMGDYRQYKTDEEATEALRARYGGDGSHKNSKCAIMDFANKVQIGDVLIVKKGRRKLLGMGVVKSDYYYDESQKEFHSRRDVDWTLKGEWEANHNLVMKTLTDITKYKGYPQKLINLMQGGNPTFDGMTVAEDASDRNYWWLVANPKIWSFGNIKEGEIIDYRLFSDKGFKRSIFRNFLEAREGDIIIGYEATPKKKIVATLEVAKEQDGNVILFRKNKDLENPISYSDIKNEAGLQRMEFMINPQGSFFKLTPEEYSIICKLIGEKHDVPEIAKYTREDFLSEVYMNRASLSTLTGLLKAKKNVILQGAPGVGKTFTAKRLAYAMMGKKDESRIKMVQFHQNYSYEDFIMGYRPSGDGFVLREGPFYKFCKEAEKQPDKDFFFIIDEINRANLSKVFGELLMLIENTYRGEEHAIRLAYRDEEFSVPENLYIIGMMNTADRSLAMIDYALRRRFSFYEMEPAFENETFKKYIDGFDNKKLGKLIDAVKKLNNAIEGDDSLGSGFRIGHSYFCLPEGETWDEDKLSNVVNYDIAPMLEEYWFDDSKKSKEQIEELKKAIE